MKYTRKYTQKYTQKYTRKNIKRRYDQNPKLYKSFFCNGIKSQAVLSDKLNELESMLPKNHSKPPIPTIHLFPYCSEKVHISKYINKVNESSIEKSILDIIQNTLSVNISTMPEIHDAGNNYTSEYNPAKFKEYIESGDIPQGNLFIIVHSNFLKALTTLYGAKIAFDNLDILQIQLELSNRRNSRLLVRRYVNNWKTSSGKSKKTGTDGVQNIFLMRHCVACNNMIEPTLKNKKFTHLIKRIDGELGYSKYSICSPYTISEITSKKKYLIKILNKECGGIANVKFGSSVIFRAILTCSLLIRCLET